MKKTTILIDGGYLKEAVIDAGYVYSWKAVELVAKEAIDPQTEDLLRNYFYDCSPFNGEVPLPVSDGRLTFSRDDNLLRGIEILPHFAVRRGTLKFRGWKPKQIPLRKQTITDDDFYPDFEQKGVDMKIGLDIANFSNLGTIERIKIISGDTDLIPAMKKARISGLEIGMVVLPNQKISHELRTHSDLLFFMDRWPDELKKFDPDYKKNLDY